MSTSKRTCSPTFRHYFRRSICHSQRPDHCFRVNVISKDLNSFPSLPGLKPVLICLSLSEQAIVVRNFTFFPLISNSLPVKVNVLASASKVPVHMFMAKRFVMEHV